MYTLTTPLGAVHGVGATTRAKLYEQNIKTVLDLLLSVPLRYEDRSSFKEIAELVVDELVTIKAEVSAVSCFYKNKRLICSATVTDSSGKVKLMWFNNKFVKSSLKVGEEYFFSGKLSSYKCITQPSFEPVRAETLHTNRLVPQYTSTLDMKQGTLRRILKHMCDELQTEPDTIAEIARQNECAVPDLTTALQQLHFPEESDAVPLARERLALEELIVLIKRSQMIKSSWKSRGRAPVVPLLPLPNCVPTTIPFELTASQSRSTTEILSDISQPSSMNRLLIGDVGSGKTIVAGIALRHVLRHGCYSCLIAPTQILAEQHAQTLQQFFPDCPMALLSGKGVRVWRNTTWESTSVTELLQQPYLIIGTHAVINFLEKSTLLHPLALVVYDEQHRFGVRQRSIVSDHPSHPHLLTMTATPIPRSLMLTIFSHLDVSTIDELPKNRVPTKTWVLPESKRASLLEWTYNQMHSGEAQRVKGQFLTLVVCPFIEQSSIESLSTVAAAKELFETLQKDSPGDISVALLHGKMSATEKEELLAQLVAKEIDLLVTTPIVEVGIDLPQASLIIIEAAERFGLASLHQLRGRVGRAGQQGYCALFQSQRSSTALKRLKQLEEITNGRELAELDLEHRGAGDLFGTAQHGFDELRFASWTNTTLIRQAQVVSGKLPKTWKSVFESELTTLTPASN